jgi:predicted transcriptional regulator of viral defense system
MTTKKTILSEKEYNLLEKMIDKYGIIITFDNIYVLLKDKMNRQSVRNLTNKLSNNGWLVRIKKGTYSISNLESRGSLSIPTFKIAQTLLKDSYISFESALQYYGMFDQMLKTITSISIKRHKPTNIQGTVYKFVKVKKKLFFGLEEKRVENYMVRIATLEKAILDILNFKRNEYYIDLVVEKLKEYKDNFDFARLNKFVSKYPKTIQRITGFLFDKLSIDSSFIYNLIKKDTGCSYMTKNSKNFNAKWRLYYHSHFENI